MEKICYRKSIRNVYIIFELANILSFLKYGKLNKRS